jgi:ribosomal protein S18 acetylase RimI-like enzyme
MSSTPLPPQSADQIVTGGQTTTPAAPTRSNDWLVERLDSTAAGELLTLQLAAFVKPAQDHADLNLPPLLENLSDLQASLVAGNTVALGIRQAHRLVAAVRLHRNASTVNLERLIVAPDCQGQGLGTILLQAAETVFPHCQSIQLCTGQYSLQSIQLYQRLGYQISQHSPADGYELIHFVKAIPPTLESS